jgi:hypothetical protein
MHMVSGPQGGLVPALPSHPATAISYGEEQGEQGRQGRENTSDRVPPSSKEALSVRRQ